MEGVEGKREQGRSPECESYDIHGERRALYKRVVHGGSRETRAESVTEEMFR